MWKVRWSSRLIFATKVVAPIWQLPIISNVHSFFLDVPQCKDILRTKLLIMFSELCSKIFPKFFGQFFLSYVWAILFWHMKNFCSYTQAKKSCRHHSKMKVFPVVGRCLFSVTNPQLSIFYWKYVQMQL